MGERGFWYIALASFCLRRPEITSEMLALDGIMYMSMFVCPQLFVPAVLVSSRHCLRKLCVSCKDNRKPAAKRWSFASFVHSDYTLKLRRPKDYVGV